MILPKRTIRRLKKLPGNWEVDQDPAGVSLFIDHKSTALAYYSDEGDFGNKRPAIHFVCEEGREAGRIFELLVSRLCLGFENTPSRNPLYIRLSDEQTDLIAAASRMGFLPYFGDWKESNATQSVQSWASITESLRTCYPDGYACA